MPTNKPLIKTYIDKTYKDKFKYIADQDHRSDSNMLEKLIIDCVDKYEAEYGQLIVGEDGNIKVAKPTPVCKDESSSSRTS